jgi:hypothetical protein
LPLAYAYAYAYAYATLTYHAINTKGPLDLVAFGRKLIRLGAPPTAVRRMQAHVRAALRRPLPGV